jgi:hypothetical protein
MQANKLSALTAAVIATAAVLFTTVPSRSQTPPQVPPARQVRPAPPVRPTPRVATAPRPPATVTVRKRSYLDPGTETKARREHDLDYAQPDVEYGFAPMRNSTLFMNNAVGPFIHGRSPFPTCLDLPGFCQ